MQVFKAFLKTAKKSIPMNLMYFVIFSILALAFSHTSSDNSNPAFSAVKLEIAVIDEDHSNASAALKEYLGGMHHLTEISYDKSYLLDQLFYRNIHYVLILPKGFAQNLSAGKDKLFETMQIPGVYSSAFVDQQINAYLKTVRICLAGSFSLDDALARAADTLSASANQVHILAPKETETSAMKGIYFYYQFLPYVILSMILCGMTPILTTFWEPELAKRISCSSESLLRQNLQLALGSIVYCFCIWILFGLTARIFYGAEIFSGQGLLCIGNSLLLLPVGVAISLIVGSFRPPANTVNMLNNIITLGMSFLCGIFVPQQQLGENVLAVSKFLPFYWYIKNNDMIAGFSGKAFEMGSYGQFIGIQALFAFTLFAIALVVSRFRQRAAH